MQEKKDSFFADDDRHRILEAIEEQAKNIAMSRGDAGQHRLSDWLSAAEEVVPEMKKPTVKSMSTGFGVPDTKPNTTNLLALLFGGTVLLTLAGLGGFAAYSLHQNMTELSAEQSRLTEQIAELMEQQHRLTEQLDQRIVTEVGQTHAAIAPSTPENAIADRQEPEPAVAKSEVESLLDARFNQLISLLDQRASLGAVPTDIQMNTVQATLSNGVQVQPIPAMPEAVRSEPIAAEQIPVTSQTTDAQIQAPVPPVVSEEPEVPTVGEEATKLDHPNYWLFGLSENSLLLQLGSSVKSEGFDDVIKKIRHQPELAHVLTVNANGSKRYVLAYGPFTSKEAAKQASDRVKQEVGVTPWVRKVSDVQKLAEKP